MRKTDHDTVERLSDEPCDSPVTIWLTKTQKRIYERLRDEKKINSAAEVKKAAVPRLYELADKYLTDPAA